MTADPQARGVADIIGRSLLARSLVPAVACLVLFTGYLCMQQKAEVEAQDVKYAQSLAAFVQGNMSATWTALGHFADQARPDSLKDMLAIMPSMERLFWVDTRGNILAVAPPEAMERNFCLHFDERPGRRLLLSRPLPSPDGHGMNLLVGVRNESGMVLAAEMSLREITQYLTEITGIWPDEVIVCDRFGNLISHPDQGRVLRQENIGDSPLFKAAVNDRRSLVYGEDGAYYLGAAAKAPELGWLVLVRRSAWRALAPALIRVAKGATLMAVALVAFTLVVRRELDIKIAKPMERSTASLAQADAGRGVRFPERPVFSELQRFERAVQDMANRLQTGALRLQESEQRFRAIFEQAGVGMVQCDATGRFLRANAFFLKLTGYDESALTGLTFTEITHPGDLPRDLQLRKRLAQGTIGPYALDKRYLRPNGESVWVNLSVAAVRDARQEVDSYIGVAVDITARKLAEQAIDASLREKETLLREIHHRVKNNLQIISSLISLQSDRIRDPWVLEQFAICSNRVSSMALIHEELYGSTNLAQVNVRHYVERLAPKLVATYQAKRPVVCRVEADDVTLNIDQAVPFGLVVNELVTNAAKHAFRENGGTITVTVRRVDRTVEAGVSDDGVGLPEGFDPAGATTLGLSLVTQLVRQLHGELVMGQGPGASLGFRFPVKET